MTRLLTIKNLSKSYGSVRALCSFSAVLDTGVYALLGPNGSGKSTLMNILTQNTKADGGDILFRGENTETLGRRYREHIGFMPQNAGIPGGFTLWEFLMYMACLKGIERKEAISQGEAILQSLDLEELKHRRIGTFSGGMKQRTLLAQAILGNPDFLILDEPTAGLDPMQRLRVKNLLSAYGREHTVLIATHIASDIQNLATDLLFLKKGVLIAQDSLEGLQVSLQGLFWDLPARELAPEHTVVKLLQEGNTPVVRVYCASKPSVSAVAALPDVEDCYFSYFGAETT